MTPSDRETGTEAALSERLSRLRSSLRLAGFICNSPQGLVNLSGTYVVWQSGGMETPSATKKYKNHRVPVEISSHAVWLYLRFCLSFRDVEEILWERGVIVPDEAIRQGCRKVGQP
jgi:hypothetical protein